jgi:hypothetical protein
VASQSSFKTTVSRRAFEDTLSVIGKSGLDVLIGDLEACNNYGEYLDEQVLALCLRQFFGDAGGELLLLRIKIRNRELVPESASV